MEKRRDFSHAEAVMEAETVFRANRLGVTFRQLLQLESSISDGLYGHAALGTRNPEWMIKAVEVAREVGEDKAREILSSYTGHKFAEDTSFPDMLAQLPEIAQKQAIILTRTKIDPITTNIKKIPKNKLLQRKQKK